MKNTITLLMFSFSICTFAQVAIGKSSVTTLPSTTTPNPSISLEFGDYIAGQGKGLIVPWVQSISAVNTAGVEQGTIVFDTSDKILKYSKNGGTWIALTRNEIAVIDGNQVNTQGQVDTSLQNNINDNPLAKASVGTPSATKGILVLEDSNKAMVLPKVPSPHINIVNPEPGLMVYDTANKQLAVFNGKVWTFWKATN